MAASVGPTSPANGAPSASDPTGFAAFGDALARFKPDLVFFSAGFDAHVEEHQCKGKTRGIGVGGPQYERLTRMLIEKLGGGVPCISVLEGGYAAAALSDGLAHHLRGLAAGPAAATTGPEKFGEADVCAVAPAPAAPLGVLYQGEPLD